jgi:hypothetical protein
MGCWIRIRIEVNRWIPILIRIKVKIQKLLMPQMESRGGAIGAHNGGLEAKMKPWRVCRQVVEDSHHFEEEQDPDPH